MTPSRLYRFVGSVWIAGIAWITLAGTDGPSVCIIKRVTALPCPSCGVTRGIRMLFQGDFAGAVQMNPLSLILALVTIGIPVIFTYDLLGRHRVFWRMWHTIELQIRRKVVAYPLIGLMACNWIWNIMKGL